MGNEESMTPEAVASADDLTLKQAFIRFAIAQGVLRFGEYTLKSGRLSPYFFDSGRFSDGHALMLLGCFYAATHVRSGDACEVLFGPAYKGIPLAVAMGAALARDHGQNPGVAYNRKEAKDHGEGGRMVGADLAARVLLVDDVITAGTAVREVLPLIEQAGGTLVGILTALDRQERGQGNRSAVQELRAELGVPVRSIITLADLEGWLEGTDDRTLLERVRAYRQQYGCESDRVVDAS